MTSALVALLAATLYLAATAGLVRALRTDPDSGRGAFWLALPAIGLHAAAHALGWARLAGPDLHFFAALSLVALGMAALGTLAVLLLIAALTDAPWWHFRRRPLPGAVPIRREPFPVDRPSRAA